MTGRDRTEGRSPGHPTFGLALAGLVVIILILSSLGSGSRWGDNAAAIPGASTATPQPPGPSGGDWPTYLQNPARSSANLAETTLSVSNAKQIGVDWSTLLPGPISGSTTVVGTVSYVGSWNGYEYALNASTGKVLWKTFLGTTTTSACGTQGIVSSATVLDDTLYIGGGDGNWYVLNATTGEVEWMLPIGEPSQGYDNWASPLISEGFAYVGVASDCDKPLVPGGLLQVNLTSHGVEAEFHTTPTGELGASVWGSPTVDASSNTIYFATGNAQKGELGELDDSIVAVNATTMALDATWKIPSTEQIADGDFGSTPTLFVTSNGVSMVGALNKNGFFYAWAAGDVAAGPVWEVKLTTGQSVGSAAFAHGLVFVGTGTANFLGVRSSGAAWALDPDTGAVVWEQPLWGRSVSAPGYANGLLVIDGGDHIFVLNAATGAKLKNFKCAATFFAPPAIAHGRILVGCFDGHEEAFGLPFESVPAPLAPASLLPALAAPAANFREEIGSFRGQ